MRQKIATLLIRVSAVVTVLAAAIIVFGPVMWLEFPDMDLWALICAVMALWAYSPKIRPLRELWIFGVFRIFLTAWELVETWIFKENFHAASQIGLAVLLAGTLLYVAGLALWREPDAAETEPGTEAENE